MLSKTLACPPLESCTWRVRGDLVSRLITPIPHIVTLVIPIINLLTKSPDPPSSGYILSLLRLKAALKLMRF